MWGKTNLPKKEVVPFIISKRGCCNLKLIIDETASTKEQRRLAGDNTYLINSRTLREFMEEYSDGQICIQSEDPNKFSTRVKIYDYASDFLRKHAGDHPGEEEKTALINALKYLFPAFQLKTDKILRSYLNDKMKNIRRKLTEANKDSVKCSQKRKSEDEITLQRKKKKEKQEIEANLDWLKYANVVTDRVKIREYLEITLEGRMKEALAKGFSVMESYSIFHCDPELVIYIYYLELIFLNKNLFFRFCSILTIDSKENTSNFSTQSQIISMPALTYFMKITTILYFH